MKRIVFVILCAALYACNQSAQNTEASTQSEESTTELEKIAINYYGDTINGEGAISPADLQTKMEGVDSMEVVLTATINETCANKGCWMTLDMGNNEEMRVRFKDYGFFVPTSGVGGKKATVRGIAFTDTVSVDDQRHYAEDANKSAEEIAAITEPKIRMNFEATGVIIED